MRSKSILIILSVILCFGEQNSEATVIFDDGGIHTIDYIIDDTVIVKNTLSGEKTTINIVSGGKINDDLSALDDSLINIQGGAIENALVSSHNSIINISGGTIFDLIAHHQSEVIVSGGEIGSLEYTRSLCAYDNSHIIITDGIIYYLFSSFENSQIEIYGGIYPHGLWVEDDGLITVYGKDFVLHDNGRSYIPGYGMIPAGTIYDRLTGILANNSSIDTNLGWSPSDPGNIVLAIPEPSTLLLFGFCAIILKRRR